MILYRCFAWNTAAGETEPDGPLWFPRPYQGEGRHDNPGAYGCLYLAESELSCVVEQFARFRGQRLSPALLRRRGLPLALAAIEFSDAVLVNLDDPAVLDREGLRPSVVATRQRTVTQRQALALHERHHDAAGLRWWSTYEALWANVSVFDRAAPLMRVAAVSELSLDHPAVTAAAEFFALRG